MDTEGSNERLNLYKYTICKSSNLRSQEIDTI